MTQRGHVGYPHMVSVHPHQSIPTQRPQYYDSNNYHATAGTPLGGRNTYALEPVLQAAYTGQQSEPSYFLVNRLTDDHHSVLLGQLTNYATAWREIGTYLGFTQGQLNNIQANQLLAMNSPVSWLNEMLSQWLQWAPGDSRGSTSFATLEALKAALNQARLGATAHDLGV